MSGQIYQVGIHLTARDGVSGVLASIGKTVLGLDASVHHLHEGFSAFRLGVMGAASAMAGSAILHSVGHLVEKGNELVKLQRDMAQAGATGVQVQNAYAKSWEMTAKYQNISAGEILKMQNDARMTFGSQDLATQHIGPFVEMASFLKAYQGGQHAGMSDQLMREVTSSMKSSELFGKITPQEMTESVRELTAMKIAYGDGLKVQTYLAAQRTAGVSLRNSSDDFRYGMFPALVQEQGSNAGVMMMTAFNKIVAGTGNKINAINKMVDIGLVKEGDVERDPKTHKIHGLKAGLEGSYSAAINFGDWVMTTLKPDLDRKLAGIADPSRRNVAESQLISGIFPDRNAAKAVTEILQQFTKLDKDSKQMAAARKAMNMDEYTKGSFDYQLGAFNEQIDNFEKLLGSALVPKATEYLRDLNGVLNDVVQWAAANPGKMTLIADSVTILGAALAGLGVVMTTGAMAMALGMVSPIVIGLGAIAAGTIGLGAAMHELAPKQFEEWWAGFKTLTHGVATFNWHEILDGLSKEMKGVLGLLPTSLTDEIATWPGKLKDAIVAFGAAFVDQIKFLFLTIPSMIADLIKKSISFTGEGLGGGGGFQRTSWGGGGGGGGLGGSGSGGYVGGSGTDFAGVGVGGSDWYSAVMRGEGTTGSGYNTVLGNGLYGRPKGNLTDMTLAQVAAAGEAIRHNPRNPFNSSAMGAFQIVGTTMRAAAKALGYDWNTTKFDPEHQRAMADWIRGHQGLGAWEGLNSHPNEMRNAMRGGRGHAIHIPAPPRNGQSITVQANLHIDGKKIARHTMTAMVDSLRGPNRGSQMPDDSRAPYGTGSAYSPSFA